MRVTDGQLFHRISTATQKARMKLEGVSEPLMTGESISRPSQDPLKAQRIERARRAERRASQYDSNISRAQVYHQVVETSTMQVVDILGQMQTLSIMIANDGIDPGALKAAATEVDRLMDGLKSMANAKHDGRYIFAGRSQDKPAYDENNVFVGDAVGRTVQIGDGQTITADVPGLVLFGDPADGPTAFDVALAFKEALESGDNSAIQESISALKDAHERSTLALTQIGFVLKDLSAAQSFEEDKQYQAQILESQLSSADIAKAASELAFAENVYEASLSTARRLTQTLRSETQL